MADVERVFADLTELVDSVNAGDSGLIAIQRLVELTQRALDAVGASFAEYGSAGGRVIAASGDSAWAVGRFVDPGDQLVAKMIGLGRIIEATLDDIPTDLAGHLRAKGIRRMLAARAELTGHVVGTLHAYFSDGGRPEPVQRSTISFLATAAGHLYGDNRGLPVYADGPVVASLADAIAVVGPDNRVRSWNPAAVMVTGWSAADVVGQPMPVSLPVIGQFVDHRLPDGRWLQILATAIPGSDARLVTMRDISETHRGEQARDLFAAVTGHELRTPVTVIKGYADTLVDHWDELDEPGRREAALRLGQRAGDLARLVDRLLSAVADSSRPDGTRLTIPFDLADALRAATLDLPGEVRRLVRVELADNLPKVLGDRTTVPSLLSELVTNAVKYSPPDSPVLLSAVVDARAVGFRVADRGIGVSPQHVERAFERFWQADSGNQRRSGGVGLGLYLVRRMVERQNGWVSLRPRERGGTVAEVRLPRADLGPGEA
jgi:signal transduction histidine kinase